jgi:hypothetical protein
VILQRSKRSALLINSMMIVWSISLTFYLSETKSKLSEVRIMPTYVLLLFWSTEPDHQTPHLYYKKYSNYFNYLKIQSLEKGFSANINSWPGYILDCVSYCLFLFPALCNSVECCF